MSHLFEPASSGRSKCRGCRKAYFETDDVLDRVLRFSLDLSADEREELRRACGAGLEGIVKSRSG